MRTKNYKQVSEQIEFACIEITQNLGGISQIGRVFDPGKSFTKHNKKVVQASKKHGIPEKVLFKILRATK